MRVVTSLLLVVVLSFPSSHADETADSLEKRLLAKFEALLADSLSHASTGCVDCHASQSTSNLILSGNSLEDFRRLLDGGYLRASGPDTLLGRVTSDHPERRMPKEAEPWDNRKIDKLKRLVDFVESRQLESGLATDEMFPRSLLSQYQGEAPESASTQFISYRQLKAKIRSIFNDDWVRGSRDLFAENIAAFGGADFQTRFNESPNVTATYLSALEMLSRDVASRAYRQRLGPFENWPEPEQAALDSDLVAQAIDRLFQAILFRSPTKSEVQEAVHLLRNISQMEELVSQRDSEIVFELTVTDPETSLKGHQTITIPVNGDRLGVTQALIDQSLASSDRSWLLNSIFRPVVTQIASRILPADNTRPLEYRDIGRVQLGGGQTARLVIHNKGTHRNVSFAGVELLSSKGVVSNTIGVDSDEVEIEGAWDREQSGKVISLEDKRRHKGLSLISVLLNTESSNEYTVRLLWKPDAANASQVLVELYGNVNQDRLAEFGEHLTNHTVAWEKSPAEQGSADFYYDCGNDARPYVELPASFQFDHQSAIEISNKGTFERVTAGAVDLINADDPENNFLIDSKFAEGADHWQKFDEGRFKAYNVRGQKLHDDNDNKGELLLRYQLADRVEHGWRSDQFYRVRIYYPGKRDHDPRVPVTVYASRSSPIVRVSRPLIAKSDSNIRLDASSSFTVQRSQLEFHWRQLSGPPVDVEDSQSPILQFKASRQSAPKLAWVSLCSALVRHPDFLFTRAPSIDITKGPARQKLWLAKIATDLVGRPPTATEFEQLASGRSLEEMVDQYLDSEDFRDFYFHRVRLYLESQGTDIQDEPARLWCYIAFNDRPFQEILTADYSVTEEFECIERAEHHGRTGLLTMKGFIEGKPGLPHYNYAAQVSMLFLGYVYEVPPEIVEQREGVTALGTTDPQSTCYSCHKILTPLAFQRLNWTDDGEFRQVNDDGLEIDASDRGSVEEYPFKGSGLEAFATQAAKKERFIRTMLNTHINFYLGRPMHHLEHERQLYKRLWDSVHRNGFKLRSLIREIVTSPEYLALGPSAATQVASSAKNGVEPKLAVEDIR